MRFSVIISVYNVAPYLRACLDSVCAAVQELECRVGVGERTDHPSVEVICVDDGSTDGSGELLDEYASRQSNNQTIPNQTIFRVLHQENRGVSAARNAALEAATGNWIGFLDGDDIYHQDILMMVARMVKAYPAADVIRFGLKSFADGGRCDWPSSSGRTVVRDLSCELDGCALGGWFCQRFYRRDLVRELRFASLTNGEDMLFMVQALVKSCREVAIDFTGYGYRRRKGSASSRTPDLTYVESILTYGEAALSELARSGKAIDPVFVRLMVNQMSEFVVDKMRGLGQADRKTALSFVAPKWKAIGGSPLPSGFQRLRFRLFGACPFWPLALTIWGLPYSLKRMGLRRGVKR